MGSFFWRNIPQQEVLLPVILRAAEGRPARVLDIGSSSGEAILTYAILLHETLGPDWQRRVCITCIEPVGLKCQRFRRGIYYDSTLHQMPMPIRRKYVQSADLLARQRLSDGSFYEQRLVFLDLRFQAGVDLWQGPFQDYSPSPPYDLVFCQNVLFHLPLAAASDCLRKAIGLLAERGTIACGGRHLENVEDLRACGLVPAEVDHETIYRGWTQRQRCHDTAFRPKPYATSDPLWKYKIGSLFVRKRT